MLVKFTNRNEELRGMPIYLMTEHIISVYEIPTDGGSLATAIYGIRGDTWIVDEGLSDVIGIVSGAIIDAR